jgi:hypothetical protein
MRCVRLGGQIRGCPRNCRRIADDQTNHWSPHTGSLGRWSKATTREPGNRISFRVKNLTNKLYAAWGDPGYTDQIILGAPRSYEVAASFRW